MRLTVDTNVLVRAVVRDEDQARVAVQALKDAEVIAVSSACLCEFVWVLRKVYGFGRADIAAAIDELLDAANVVVDAPAVVAGLAVLKEGGDFADGVIGYEGAWLGGETFASFDKKAVSLVAKAGLRSHLLRP